MDNLTAGNPVAHRVRVYFEGATTIYEGMPVCYNYNTTTNWFGGSVSDEGVVTATTTTSEGSQNEGKYVRVERPVDGNLLHFAGVVARGGWVGKTGPKVVDIYIPNGAIVPVRCDVDTTVGLTVLCIQEGEEELGFSNGVGTSRPVAIAMEDETDLDGGADITLAKLDPNMFIYQALDGTSLSLGSGTNCGIIDMTSSSTSLIIGQQFKLSQTGTGALGAYGTLIRLTTVGTAIAGPCYGCWIQTTLGASSVVTSGYRAAGALIKTHVLSTAGTHEGDIYACHFAIGLDKAVNGKTAQLYFESQTSVGEHVDYWFVTRGGSNGEDIGFAPSTQGTNQFGSIKIRFGYAGADKWIAVYDTVGAGA